MCGVWSIRDELYSEERREVTRHKAEMNYPSASSGG
jgi:hypothetical protein